MTMNVNNLRLLLAQSHVPYRTDDITFSCEDGDFFFSVQRRLSSESADWLGSANAQRFSWVMRQNTPEFHSLNPVIQQMNHM
jgi:hypothetical protein